MLCLLKLMEQLQESNSVGKTGPGHLHTQTHTHTHIPDICPPTLDICPFAYSESGHLPPISIFFKLF